MFGTSKSGLVRIVRKNWRAECKSQEGSGIERRISLESFLKTYASKELKGIVCLRKSDLGALIDSFVAPRPIPVKTMGPPDSSANIPVGNFLNMSFFIVFSIDDIFLRMRSLIIFDGEMVCHPKVLYLNNLKIFGLKKDFLS